MKIKNDKIAEVKDDMLNRNAVAEEIAKGLRAYLSKNKEGLTLSVTGEWGSGKSTLLSYVKTILENKGDTLKIIEFNPWMFYKEESIKMAFLSELAISLDDFETKTVKVASRINDLIKGFRWIKYLNSTAGNIQDGLEKASQHFSSPYNIHDIKKEIDEALRKSKKKVLILMDDLDRLLPEQITEVLQTISLVTNFSNVIYILAFDRQIVIEALNKTYNGKGQEYLEKIIQVDYELPVIREELLRRIFFADLLELEKEYKTRIDTPYVEQLWNQHGLRDYFNSIRDFKKFFNALHFRLPAIAREVYPPDFIALEAIRLFDYNSYTLFYRYYKENARKKRLTNEGLDEEQFNQLKPNAAEIIRALFDRSNASAEASDSNRLLYPGSFDRYFTLIRNNIPVWEQDIRDLIQRKKDRSGILDQQLRFDDLTDLISDMADSGIHEAYPDYDFSLVSDFIRYFNRNASFFEKHAEAAARMLVNLICNPRHPEFIRQFFDSFGEQGWQPSPVHYYFFYFMRENYHSNEQDRSFNEDCPEFEDYYLDNYDRINHEFKNILENSLNIIGDHQYTEKCPQIKFYFATFYTDLVDNHYEFQETLYKDWKFMLYILGKFILLDNNLQVTGYNWDWASTLFSKDQFRTFQEKIRLVFAGNLSKREKALRNHFVSLDLSDYENLKAPEYEEF